MSGKFIVFEGVEGAGKTTQIQKTYKFLQDHGKRVIITREPGGTELGLKFRHILLDDSLQNPLSDRTELLLYAADRAQHMEELIKPALAEGVMILCDRFTDSTIAYQGYGRGLDLELIHQLNKIATEGLESHLTFWLKIDVRIGLERTKKRGDCNRMEKATLQFHQRVESGFQTLAEEYPHRIIPIDSSQTEEMVSQEIQTILSKKLTEWG